MSAMRWAIAHLNSPPEHILAGDGNLTENHSEWSQDPRFWTVFYYHHANALTLNTHTYAIEAGDIAFIPPGSACQHAGYAGDHWVDFMTFILPGSEGIRCAIPHLARDLQAYFPNFRKASNRIMDTTAPSQAFLWNLLWLVSQSATLFRENESLYVAEDFIRRNMAKKFTVQEVAEAAGTTQRNLLKIFRDEHGVTIQEFVLRKRVQEASRLLLTSDLAIKEIAARVGMPDLQYFNKTMRSLTGLAPTRVRESQRNASKPADGGA